MTSTVELDDADREHIAELVRQGYTSGEVAATEDECTTYVPPPGAETYEAPCAECRKLAGDHDAQPCPDCGTRCTWSEERGDWIHERSVPECFLSQGAT